MSVDAFLVVSKHASKIVPENNKILLISDALASPTGKAGGNTIVLQDPWSEKQKREAAYRKYHELYKKLLPSLSKELNKFHGRNYTEKFWMILIGPWLMYFIVSIIDKHTKITEAKKLFKNIKLLRDKNYRLEAIEDTESFGRLSRENQEFNQELYSRIGALMGLSIKKVRQNNLPDRAKYRNRHKMKKLFFSFILRIIAKVVNKRLTTVYSFHTFDKLTMLRIMLKSRFKAIPLFFPYNKKFRTKNLDRERDFLISLKEECNNELHGFCISLIPKYLPKVFLENFAEYEKQIKTHYLNPSISKFVVSGCIYANETIKLFAALQVEEYKSKLLVYQHGGDYGIFCDHLQEKHEIKVSDTFFSWGWEPENIDSKKIKKSTITRLSKQKERVSKKPDKQEILYVSDNQALFPISKFFSYNNSLSYTDRFFSKIPDELASRLRIRLHPNDSGWGKKCRIKKAGKDLYFDDLSQPFETRLKNSKIMIVDHISTTYLEALRENVPLILFYPTGSLDLKPNAKKYFKLLQKVNILHTTPESALEWLIKVCPEVDKWWLAENTQKIRKSFCEKYCNSSLNQISDRIEELR